eukprot:g1144.t1
MVKSYFRYAHKASFGVISSYRGNVLFASSPDECFTASLEDVAIWNLRQGARVGTLSAEAEAGVDVTVLAKNAPTGLVAAGYSDGTVRIFNQQTRELVVTLKGHKKEIGALAFTADGSRLASGSRDTDVIIWDVISETGQVRLRGHKDEVTGVAFVERAGANMLVSASKDTLLKVWDLTTQHCVQTCVGHRTEVWSIAIDPQQRRLITGASDDQIRLWSINAGDEPAAADAAADDRGEAGQSSAKAEPAPPLKLLGAFTRATPGRTVLVKFSRDGQFFGCLGAGQAVEIFAKSTAEQLERKVKRRRKRWREKQKKAAAAAAAPSDGGGGAVAAAELGPEPGLTPLPTDAYEALDVLRSSHKTKVRSFDVVSRADADAGAGAGAGAGVCASVLLGLFNNTLEVHQIKTQPAVASARTAAVALPGHRSDIRAVALSSDDATLLSCSSGAAKVWNVETMQCVRTLPVADNGVALCGCFLPGNRHVAIGTKEGKLQLFDLASGSCLEEHAAHEGAIWSLALRPDKRGLASASADHSVKFWMFELVAEAPGTPERVGMEHTRTLKMTDDVLCVRFSHTSRDDQQLLAVALMDNTVKVFHADTLKFFLSLYGHKLPVMCCDISTDNSLMVTASADKNVKLWGLDFGDCHCSLFAHADSVMGVVFVPRTHHFFTVGKDRLLKYWDGDAREHIMSLDMHRGEAWCVAVSSLGDFVVTGSHDRSLRVWKRTEEQLFLEEEKEKALEAEFDKMNEAADAEDGADGAPGDTAAAAGRADAITVAWSERLIDALDVASNERKQHEAWLEEEERAERALPAKKLAARRAEQAKRAAPKPLVPPPQPNMLMLGRSPVQHVAHTLRLIKAGDLEQALITLPFNWVEVLLRFLNEMLAGGSSAVELVARCVSFILRTYHDQIVANSMLRSTLDDLRVRMRNALQAERDCIGFNLAGLRSLKRKCHSRHFDGAAETAPAKRSSST